MVVFGTGIFKSTAAALAVSGVLLALQYDASAETKAPRSKAQPVADVAKELAPTGKLRVAILMLTYFAVEEGGKLQGWSPDLGIELARRLKVPYELVPIRNPADMIDALSNGKADVTFIGITKDRAAAFDYGPVIIGLRTTFLVPAKSSIRSIPNVDQTGVRIVVPARSAQGEHLETIIKNATLLRVPVETTKPATDLIAEGKAEAFSHVVPMLVVAQASLPGSRILPGSYYDVPIAIAYPKGRSAAVAEYCKKFAEDMKSSGFAKKAIAKMGRNADGVVVAP
jgi:polar amino acid transport system substrate-binding protein